MWGRGVVPRGHVTSARVSEHQPYPDAERLDLVEVLHGHRVADPYRWLEDPEDPRTGRLVGGAGPAGARPPRRAARPRRARRPPARPAGRRLGVRAAVAGGPPVLHPPRAGAGARRAATSASPAAPSACCSTRWPSTRPASPPSTPGCPTWRAGGWPTSSPSAATSTRCCTCSTSPPASASRRRSTGAATPRWRGCPAASEFVYVRMVAADEAGPGEHDLPPPGVAAPRRHPDGADELIDGPGLYVEHTYYGRARLPRRALAAGHRQRRHRAPGQRLDRAARPGRPDAGPAPAPHPGRRRAVRRLGRARRPALPAHHRRRAALAPRRHRPAHAGREHWRELVAEDPDSVLDGVRRLQPPARRHHGRAAGAGPQPPRGRRAGAARPPTAPRCGTVPLPGPGSLTGLSVADRGTPRSRPGRLWIGWTDFVTPPPGAPLRAPPANGAGTTVLEAAAPGAVTVPAVRTEQREFTSADGTTVRMFVITPAGATSGPRPTLVTGYGGFGISREPATRRPRWPGWRRAAATRSSRCAAAARRARSGTSRATARTSRTCSTTCTPRRRAGRRR